MMKRWLAGALVVTVLGLPMLAAAGPKAPAGITVLSAEAKWPGKIFVSNDEWALSDHVYTKESAQFALNLASWFARGRPGRFLVFSSNFGLNGTQVANTLRVAGHTWTVTTSGKLTLETLQQYDAVFLAGDPADNETLIDYVRGGGGVYLAGGTGFGRGAEEAARWNTFLNAFGLMLAPEYHQLQQFVSIDSQSPLFKDVRSLWVHKGNPVKTLDPANPDTQTLVTSDGVGIFAAYETTAIPVAVDISLGNCANRLNTQGRSVVHAAVLGTSDFDVTTIAPDSARLAGVAAFQTVLADVAAPEGPRFGNTRAAGCQTSPDREKDLVLLLDSRELVAAVQAMLGRAPVNNEVVALTLTGTLDELHGGTPITGEVLVRLRVKTSPTRARF